MGTVRLRVQSYLLHVKDQVSDTAVERASHLEHGCPLTLWNAPNVQAGHIYGLAFCWRAQLHFHRSCLIHLNSDNSTESKEKINVFKYNETSLSILFQQVLTNKSFPWNKFFNTKFNVWIKKGNSWTWKETAEHFPKMNVMWLNIIQFECFLEKVKVKVKSLSRVQLFAAPWTVAYQAPPSMDFSRQEYWTGLPFPSPGDLPDPGIEPWSSAL